MKPLKELLNRNEILATSLSLETSILEIVQDSRVAKPGSLFIAVKGAQNDGNQFVNEVLKKGAIAIVDGSYQGADNSSLIRVYSTRGLVGKIASRFWEHPTEKLSLVGVTGTNGKTTTTFLLDQIWIQMDVVTGLIGTVSNKIAHEVVTSNLTTPGPIELQSLFHRMVQRKVKFCAMEVSSIALEQYRTEGSRFQVGVFTNFTQDHLDYHLDMDKYFQAKLKLFTDYALPCVVVNLDDDKANEILAVSQNAKKLSFSLEQKEASFHVLQASFKKNGTVAKIQTPLGPLDIVSPLIGAHNLMNILGTLGAIHGLNQDLVLAAKSLEGAVGAPGRLERAVVGDQYPNVFVDYAHSEDALENVLRALHNLRGNSGGKIITVFGCGGDRDKSKRPKMARVASNYSDITIVTSDNPRTEDPDSILKDIEPGIDRNKTIYHREVNRKDGIHLALNLAKPEDIILIAGKGHENYQIVGTQKQYFDDRQVVKDYYSASERKS
jgi:UDP-N-acetylmuramoyl-L-alanyl-D-glutamate--2,6-diaminopimelate ligase